jgi:hypothetical protein
MNPLRLSTPGLSRRLVLRGVGGAVIALPWLEAGGRSARAAAGLQASPKRLVIFFTPNGTIHDALWPKVAPSETSFELQGILAPLERHKGRLLLVRGLDLKSASVSHGHGHQKGMGNLLTGRPLPAGTMKSASDTAGWGAGISVDQEIANVVGKGTRLPSLELGVRADNFYGSNVLTRINYRGPAQPLPPQNDPLEAWKRLFSDAGTDPAALERARARRASILDTVGQQFAAVRARVGEADRKRLDEHLSMIRDLESRLAAPPAGAGGCAPRPSPAKQTVDSEQTMPAITAAHVDLIAAAFACDLTRVATLQISNAKNYLRYPWINSMSNGHDLSHAGPSNMAAAREFAARHTWHAEQLAVLLDRLAAIKEGGGTALDHTVVLWCNELSTGNDHGHINMPFVLAGSAGGFFRTGRYVKCDHQPHNNLLVSLCNAFGLERTSFGDARFCTGPLPGLT